VDQEELLTERIAGLEKRIANLERIVKVSQILNSTLSLEPLLKIITQSAMELTSTEACSIMLLDKQTGELRFAAATGGKKEEVEKISVPLDRSVAGWVVRHAKPLLIRNTREDPRFYRQVDEVTEFETRSILGVPMQLRRSVIGVMEVLNKIDGQDFTQDDIQIASTLAAQAAIAIENARLLEELQRAYEDLSELDRLKSEFVAIASHELRTPLAVILGYASFLRKDVEGTAGEQLDMVLQSAMRLRSIIDDMVNLRHVETGEAQLELEIFSLRELIEKAAQEFGALAEAKHQDLCSTLGEGRLMVEADQQKIYLILANLLSNAVKFTPQGGRIHISVEQKEGEIWVALMDTGVGIPTRQMYHIFDRFYQVEPSLTRHFEGMGLGLSIVKDLVELHGGRIWVDSVEGMGSRFTFAIPVTQN
jgi:signal transduction histidine kinase